MAPEFPLDDVDVDDGADDGLDTSNLRFCSNFDRPVDGDAIALSAGGFG